MDKDNTISVLSRFFCNLKAREDMTKYYIKVVSMDSVTLVVAKPYCEKELVEEAFSYSLDGKNVQYVKTLAPRETYNAVINNPACEDMTWLIEWVKNNPILQGVEIRVKEIE